MEDYERGTEADCQRYIAERGNLAVFAYLAEHIYEATNWDDGCGIAEFMRLLAGAGEGGNDVA